MNNFQEHIAREVELFFEPLVRVAASEHETLLFFRDMGWHLDALAPGGDMTSFLARLTTVATQVEQLALLAQTPPQTLSEWKAYLSVTQQVVTTIDQLVQAFPAVATVAQNELGELTLDTVNMLLTVYLVRRVPAFYKFLDLIGALSHRPIEIVEANGLIIREKYKVPRFLLRKFKNYFADAKRELREKYWPNNGLATRPAANLVANELFPVLADMLEFMGFDTYYDDTFSYDASAANVNSIAAGLLTISKYYRNLQTGLTTGAGVTLGLVPTSELTAPGDAGLLVVPFGELNYSGSIGNWLVQLTGGGSLPGVQISREGAEILASEAVTQARVAADLSYLPSDGTLHIGSVTGTRLEIPYLEGQAYLQINEPRSDYGLRLNFPQSKLVLVPGDGDSFLRKVFGETKEVSLNLSVGWTKQGGFYLGADGGLEHTYRFTPRSSSFLQVAEVALGLQFSSAGEASLFAVGTGSLKLGPIVATVSKTGLQASLGFPEDGTGNLGLVNLGLGFKAPTGVGVAVDSEVLKGGGFLSIDPDNHRYTGIANLTFRDKLTLNAVGILQTELPNQQDGYSLLLLITAQFAPVQLGLGFTLNGVGGLVGVNRTLNIPYLREQVRAGHMDRLLFPANVLDNPTEVLSTVESSFPAAEGRYVFGLMAKIGWGTPTLITLDAALILELPSPVRLALLGVLQAILPDKDHPIVRLRADFLGSVDFGAKKVAFDATLTDSRILQFALTGDAAFRLYSGENPVFLLTSGGFHPAFQPPTNADLPTLRRLRLALADSNDLRIILTSYLAVTSNTVQFGSRLDVYVDLPFSFYLEGFMGFDVLFQFHPFRVAAYVGAGVAIKRKGSTKLGIYLSLNVTGPAPWHVVGEASFKVLGFKIKARIDRTFGSGATAQPLPSVDVRTLFKQALADAKSWEIEESTIKTPSSVVLQAPASAASGLLIDPSGALVLRQRLVPLDYSLEKFGNSAPVNGNRFDITDISVRNANGSLIDTGGTQEPVSDFFAPEQFRRMSDAQKLSAPSFQLMRSGRRLSGLAQLTSAAGTKRVVEYEEVVMPATSAGALVAAQAAVAEDSISRPKAAPMAPALYQKLTRNSTVGRAYRQQQPSARAAQPVQWSEDQYVVVSSRDLTLYAAEAVFENEALATEYLQGQMQAVPTLRGELAVVPAYQLEAAF